MKKAFGDDILEGITGLKPAVKLDIRAFEDECALGQLLAYPVLDHGVLETLEGLDVFSISITNLIQGLEWVQSFCLNCNYSPPCFDILNSLSS